MKRLAGYSAIVLATLAALFLLWQFRTAVILFILSLAVAAVLRPVINSLAGRGMARGLALGLTYTGVIILFVLLLFFIFGPLLNELQTLFTDLPKAYDNLQASWLKGSWIQQTLASNFPNLDNILHTLPGGKWSVFIQNFLSVTRTYLEIGSDFVIVFVLSIYWSFDEEHFKRLWLSLLPSVSRTRWRGVWERLEQEIGAYLRSELVQSVLTLIILAVGYSIIGLKYPLLLALFAALSWLIVWFGGLLAAALALFAGLLVSPLVGAGTALFTILVLFFLEFVIQPRLFNRTWISSLLIIIMVLILVSQFGLLGFLLAPPVAAVIQIFARQLLTPAPAVTNIELAAPPHVQLETLQERLVSLKGEVSSNDQTASPEVVNLVERLDKLIERVRTEDPFSE